MKTRLLIFSLAASVATFGCVTFASECDDVPAPRVAQWWTERANGPYIRGAQDHMGENWLARTTRRIWSSVSTFFGGPGWYAGNELNMSDSEIQMPAEVIFRIEHESLGCYGPG